PGCRNSVNAVFFAPDGKTLYGTEQGVLVWDLGLARPEARVVVEGWMVQPVALSRDGTRLCVCGYVPNLGLVMYHFPEFRVRWSVERLGRSLPAALAFAGDGRTLATGTYQGEVCLRDPDTGQTRQELPGVTTGVKALAFSPDGSTLACAASGHLH